MDANLWPINSSRGSFWDRLRAAEAEPYVWGQAGPPATIEHAGATLTISRGVLDDALPDLMEVYREAWRRDAIHRRAMRRLKVADLDAYERLLQLQRWAEAARQDRLLREREARRCPTCGCDPMEHDRLD